MGSSKKQIKEIVRESYGKIALSGNGCGCSRSAGDVSKSIGYSDKELAGVPEANLGLGCGNPIALGRILPGYTVLDLGCGAGMDCFLASKKVGEKGHVIGVDMTAEMVERARRNAEKYGYKNVEFRLGEIEDLPIEDNSIDVVISNCVINLSEDKEKVFREVRRVLRPSGRMFVSDIVLLEELSEEKRKNEELIAGCVANAALKGKYLEIVTRAGLEYKILHEDREISKKQYNGIALESLKLEIKIAEGP
ncbi:MAG: arsenite methyltransferase [archaeon]|nr:arsenite methyltransferase [archaeon]